MLNIYKVSMKYIRYISNVKECKVEFYGCIPLFMRVLDFFTKKVVFMLQFWVAKNLYKFIREV